MKALSKKLSVFKRGRRRWLQALGLLGVSAPAAPATWTLVTGSGGGAVTTFNSGTSVREVPGLRGSPIAMGSNFALVRRADGTVWGTGGNTKGQLGRNNITNVSRVVQVLGVSNVIAVTAGKESSFLIRGDGRVYVTGSNSSGQLLIETASPAAQSSCTLMPSGLQVRSVASGGDHTVICRAQTSLQLGAGGLNSSGQLMKKDTTNQTNPNGVQPDVASNVLMVAAGNAHNAFVRADGTLWTAGNNASGQLGNNSIANISSSVQVTGLGAVKATACGSAHTVAVLSTGTVWAVGANASGQLGDGTLTGRSSVVQAVGLSNVVAVAAGDAHTLVLRSDGLVYAFGENGSGQLGDNTVTDRSSAVKVWSISNITAIAAGGSSSMALRSDGLVFAWGNNATGQLGDASLTTRKTPVQMLL